MRTVSLDVRGRVRALLALSALAAALSGMLAAADRAHAGTYIYCGVAINPYTVCGRNDIDRFYGYNEASRPNVSGSNVVVCETLRQANTSNYPYGASCAYGSSARYYPGSIITEAEVYHTANAQLIVNGTAFD